MDTRPLLTIAIPAYNNCKFLQSCLLSISNQISIEEGDVEVIVSDDCSVDNTSKIAAVFLKYKWFKYYRQYEHIGYQRNISTLINRLADGKFCWIVRDVDFVFPKRIAELLMLLKENPSIDLFMLKSHPISIEDFKSYRQPFDTSMIGQATGGKRRTLTIEYESTFVNMLFSPATLSKRESNFVFRREIWVDQEVTLGTNGNLVTFTLRLAVAFVKRRACRLGPAVLLSLEDTPVSKAVEMYGKMRFLMQLMPFFRSKGIKAGVLERLRLKMVILWFFLLTRKLVSMSKYIVVRVFRYGIPKIKEVFNRKRLLRYFRAKNVELLGSLGATNGMLYIQNNGIIRIGKNFTFNSGSLNNPIGGDVLLRLVVPKKNAILIIGDNVGISNSTIVCHNRIEIEDGVMLGGSVKIWDTDFHSLNAEIRNSEFDNDVHTAPIKIRRNVFIGSGSIVLKGTTIGENSIVGAGSVVSKSIPANEIWAGNPAKFIRKV